MNNIKSFQIRASSGGLVGGVQANTIINGYVIPLSNFGSKKIKILGYTCDGYKVDTGNLAYTRVDFQAGVSCTDVINEMGGFNPPNISIYTARTVSMSFAADDSYKDMESPKLSSSAVITLSVIASFAAAVLNDVAFCNFTFHYEEYE